MRMIAIQDFNGNQFIRARMMAALPVIVLDATTFRIPSASRAEREHLVHFDNADSPAECSCTCEAGSLGTGCWAMARAFDVMTLLCVNQIYIGRGESGSAPAAITSVPALPAPRAEVDESGNLALMFAVPVRDDGAAVLAG